MYKRPLQHITDLPTVTNISDYFSRPVKLGNVTYDTALTENIFVFTLDNSNIQNTLTNFSRVHGAFGYRAKFCFRVQCASTPFQAGRLRLAFQPFAPNPIGNAKTMTGISQLPGVDLDIAESTSVVLKVPFVHPKSYFFVKDYGSTSETLGNVNLFAYTPVVLVPGVSYSPELTIWFWCEDFELVGAAAKDVSPQAGKFSPSTKESVAIPGNLSNVLAAGSNLVMWAGSRIPLISSYAGPLSWVTRQAANIASSYGWSKPINASSVNKVITTNSTYQHNCDGTDASHNLGAFAENAIMAYPGFAGTDIDEMSFDYIKSVYSAISRAQLTTGDVSDQYLYMCQLSPLALYYNGTNRNGIRINKVPGKSFLPSSVFGLANCFTSFRGGFKFKIKISKTKFHTGRVLLGFNPCKLIGDPTNIYGPSQPGNLQYKSVIWDLREGNEIEFECPYVCSLPYLSCELSYGSFFMTVVEPLRGPDTVSDFAPFVVEVAGMEDLEFAIPCTQRYVVAPMGSQIEFQSGSFEPTVAIAPNMSQFCVGEKINSVKQLISRANLLDVVGSGAYTYFNKLKSLYWLPNNLTPSSNTIADKTMINYFMNFYGLFRGGINLDVVPFGTDMVLSATINPGVLGLANTPIVTECRTALHVKLPFYSYYTAVEASPYDSDLPTAAAVFVSGSTSTQKAAVYKRAAEDFQFGYYIGCPSLTSLYGSGTSSVEDDFAIAASTIRS